MNIELSRRIGFAIAEMVRDKNNWVEYRERVINELEKAKDFDSLPEDIRNDLIKAENKKNK